ncbi:MAG: alpha/beta hydrolase [Methanocalculaceae archaeon]|jgi:alpha-beta hydrolase superfamily lysophospholipase|nr:alpha/beta hydrolase [Methanocalculaceae archaeon]
MTEIQQKRLTIGKIPVILWGEPAEKLYIYVHGLYGSKEEAEPFSNIVYHSGWQVLSLDLPGHGVRRDEADAFTPWDIIPELEHVLDYAKSGWRTTAVFANSIGAWFSLLAFAEESLERCLFVSPILDMERMIQDMMKQAGVTESQLEAEQRIPTESGQTLSWEYLTYVRNHPIVKWENPTRILYAENDTLTGFSVVDDFAKRFCCHLTIMENGEHWFHTPQQMEVLYSWVKEDC